RTAAVPAACRPEARGPLKLPDETRRDADRVGAALFDRGGDAVEIERAIGAELGGMDAAGDQQAGDPGALRPGDVGAQAVADRQDAPPVGDPEQAKAAVIDRRV